VSYERAMQEADRFQREADEAQEHAHRMEEHANSEREARWDEYGKAATREAALADELYWVKALNARMLNALKAALQRKRMVPEDREAFHFWKGVEALINEVEDGQ
jgi:hypothetical protein